MTTSRWQPDEETPRTYARLSGDHNPVHLDPEVAQAAGFPGVVVHGMCVLGSVARAAAAAAPSDRQLRKLDVRFAGPAFPGQELVMEPSPKELPDGSLRVMMKVTHEGQGLMAPATFVFRAGDLDEATTTTLLRGAEVEPRDDDVVAEEYTFDEGHVLDYLTLTAPDPCVEQVGLPALMGTLGLTDALWYAFANEKPEEPGNWVHLRQSGVFLEPIRMNRAYRCRVQAGLTVVRRSPAGAMITIPFTVQESVSGRLAQTGTVTLLYVLER